MKYSIKCIAVIFYVLLIMFLSDTINITTHKVEEREPEIMYEIIPSIQVNQVGYMTNGIKKFWSKEKYDRFTIVNANTSKTVFSGSIQKVGYDSAIDSVIYFGDFSPVIEEGTYFIVLDDCFKSCEFVIQRDIYESVSHSLLKMLYYQRCGIALDEPHAGEYTHDVCHADIGYVYGHEDVTIDGRGGWHDAGDYGRYTVPAARTIADLLFAYQLFPNSFDDDTGIPESENGIPDILDEARVGIEWLLKMQDIETGGVYHKFTSKTFCGMVMPEHDNFTYYAIKVSPTATGVFAAIMAKSSMMYKDIDQDFAKRCLDAANIAYAFLAEHPDYPLYENPEDVTTGDYKDQSDVDERYWAAAELYIATGDDNYLQDAKVLYSPHTALFWSDTLEWYDVGFLGTFSYMLSDRWDEDDEFSNQLKTETIKAADSLMELSKSKAYHVAMDDEDYIWGSNMVLTNRANVMLMANLIEPKAEYLQVVQSHVDYLLGCNMLGQSYVTGYGQKTIRFPHHRPSIADGIKAPIPGMVSGGPNSALQDTTAMLYFNEESPPATCFVDETSAYSLNEVTTYWNSSALFMVMGLINTHSVIQ